jgi:radical SAM protein with 4Fe4S-binding SPASM domain
VGIIHVDDHQRVEQARRELEALGVQNIGVDWLRQVGHGNARNLQPTISQLCGSCGGDFIVILPDGTISPCPISRWITIGNIQMDSLASILASQKLVHSRSNIRSAKRGDYSSTPCRPRCDETCIPPYVPPSL